MASKYNDRILAGSGISSKKFECEYGLKMLAKMGWKEGNGLGKEQAGRTECVQVKRRDENLGLGAKNTVSSFKWNDNWWDKSYSSAISKLTSIKKRKESTDQSSIESSEDEPTPIRIKTKIKKHKNTKIVKYEVESSEEEEPVIKEKKEKQKERKKRRA